MGEDDALNEAGLWHAVEGERAVAAAMVENKRHCRKAWNAAGFAVELALKAVIMRRRKFNQWPSREANPKLHTHSVRTLLDEAGIDLAQIPPYIRTNLRTVMDWTRGHDYVAGRMPRVVARNMVAATFSDEGVVAWLKTI